MDHIKKSLGFILALFVVGQLSAQDIKSSTQGFSLNLNGVYGSWNSESLFMGDLDDIEPTGLGVSIKAAYGINQNIEVMLAYGTAGFSQEFEWDSYKLSTLDFGGRYNFGATLRRIRPFVEAAVSLNSLNIDPIAFDGDPNLYNLESSGLGGSVGGGLHVFIIPNLSANANGRFIFGSFGSTSLSGIEVTNLDETLDFTITTIHIGLSYFFQ